MPDLNKHEPKPVVNTTTPIYLKVIEDLNERAVAGRRKYGTFLQKFNGRNSAIDAYQEVMDLMLYFRQMVEEFVDIIDFIHAAQEVFEDGRDIQYLKDAYEKIKVRIHSNDRNYLDFYRSHIEKG